MNLFESYQQIARQYKSLPLKSERKLIKLAKKGNTSAKQKLLFYQIGFFLYRINTMLFPSVVRKEGEDILQDFVEFAIRKIPSYNMRYRNKAGVFQPVYFRTYIWKGIDGLLFNVIKARYRKEICFSDLNDFKAKNYE